MDCQRILNFRQVTEGLASSGQPDAEQFSWIARAGYQTVINLLPPQHSEALSNEAAIVKSLGMEYFNIPVSFSQPDPAHWRQLQQLLAARQQQKVWVHCLLNYRASTFLYLYLKHSLQLPENLARAQVFTHWQPDAVWSAVWQWSFEE